VRIAFFGLPLAALLLRHDGHDVVYAGICRRGALGTRRLRRRIGPERVHVLPDTQDPALPGRLRALGPDLLVSWFWVKNLPPVIRAVAPLGTVGVHPSLLPRHRGPDPYFWTLASGDAVAGVTAHRLDDAYDTGAMLGQREISVQPTWNSWTLAKALDRPSLALLRQTCAAFAKGTPPRETPQDERQATLAPSPSDEELEIDWDQPTEQVLARIRAAAPWPGAYTFLGDEAVVITRAEPASKVLAALSPGEGAVTQSHGHTRAVVRTQDGAVALLEGRIDDDEADLPLGPMDLVDLMAKARTDL
jgi:methionyl-tRNA formyltransferase